MRRLFAYPAILALLLTLAMLFTLAPWLGVTAYADGPIPIGTAEELKKIGDTYERLTRRRGAFLDLCGEGYFS